MRRCLVLFLLVGLIASCDSGPGPNEDPTAQITFNPDDPRAGQAVTFEAQATDPDGEIEKFEWTTSDGAEGSGSTFTHAFSQRGDFSVTVTVTDNREGTAKISQQLSVRRKFSEVTIKNVTVQDMPFTDDQGNQWDSNSGPDVFYVAFNNETENTLEVSQGKFDVKPADLPITFRQTEFIVDELTEEHSIGLFDQDNEGQQLIGGVSFTLDTEPGQFPEEATIEFEDVSYQVDLDWSN